MDNAFVIAHQQKRENYISAILGPFEKEYSQIYAPVYYYGWNVGLPLHA